METEIKYYAQNQPAGSLACARQNQHRCLCVVRSASFIRIHNILHVSGIGSEHSPQGFGAGLFWAAPGIFFLEPAPEDIVFLHIF